jgi:hypothetical protein
MPCARWFDTLVMLLLAGQLIPAESGTPATATILGEYPTTYQRVATAQRSTLHWGREVTIFISRDVGRYRDNVRRGVAERAGEQFDAFVAYEPGTVLVKEQRTTTGAAPDGWSIMIRQLTPAAIGGPWRYVEVAADRRVLLDGTGADPQVLVRCAACHHQVGQRDFLFHSFADTPAKNDSP